jgi:hypothetical protein
LLARHNKSYNFRAQARFEETLEFEAREFLVCILDGRF